MLVDHIKQNILANLDFEPTSDQNNFINNLSEFILPTNKTSILLLTGYAGTGKTTVISAFIKTLKLFKQKSLQITPTGRAAKVIASYSKKPAYTIHKKIYRQKTSNDDFGKFLLGENLYTDTIFIVDEASMISNNTSNALFGSGRLLDDLIKYVFSGERCKLIIVGDVAQLPPVKSNLSPALDRHELESYGFDVAHVNLTQVVRQTQESGILHNATQIRDRITLKQKGFPKIELDNFPDIHKVNGEELIEEITSSYDNFGSENTIIITRSNKRANLFNEGIRQSVLYQEEEISTGDYLMIVKNNYFWLEPNKNTDFIANGDIVRITRIGKYEEIYGYRFANIDIQFVDYPELEISTKIILNTLNIETASLSSEAGKEFYYTIAEDYSNIKSKKKRFEEIRKNPYFNALQVKFAYAVTCHKSQGGQWKNVFIDHGYITDEDADTEFLRWLYTAFTRATKNLYLVNFKKEFFE